MTRINGPFPERARPARNSRWPAAPRALLAPALAAIVLCCAHAWAQPAPQPGAATASQAARPAATARPLKAKRIAEGPAWSALSTAQRKALAPLSQDWSAMDGANKEKWLALAAHFPSMPARERERVQNRMAEWSRLAPGERGQARLRFQQTRTLTAEERRAQWEAYKNLPPEQRAQLSQRARDRKAQAQAQAQTPPQAQRPPVPPRPQAATRPAKPVAAGEQAAVAKSNIVPHPSRESQAMRQVTPGVVRDGQGGTTTLVSRRPQPPAHLQPGMPKIAATAPFVDPDTLLPRRGAQAAAVRGSASLPESHRE